METIKLEHLSLAQAEARFPGCATDDLTETVAFGRVAPDEPDYLRFFVFEGRLLACTYEVSYLGWSEWKDARWQDLDEADTDLSVRFHAAEFEY